MDKEPVVNWLRDALRANVERPPLVVVAVAVTVVGAVEFEEDDGRGGRVVGEKE